MAFVPFLTSTEISTHCLWQSEFMLQKISIFTRCLSVSTSIQKFLIGIIESQSKNFQFYFTRYSSQCHNSVYPIGIECLINIQV